MLNFVVTKVTSDFVSRIWFYLFACFGLLSFLWAPKIQGTTLITRARVLVSKLFIPRLSLLVIAETGRNCAVSAFLCFGRVGIGKGSNSPNF